MYDVYDVSSTRVDFPGSAAEYAYETLKQMLFEQVVKPGERIGEAALTRQLGISRTPVRDALARLESEGVLRPAPGRGFIVVELSEDDLADIYKVRAALDGLAADEAARRVKRVDMARLDDIFDAMSEALAAPADDEALAALNSEFHRMIAQISGNNYLQEMLSGIQEVFERFRATALTIPGRRDEAHREHSAIIEALRRGDCAAASDIARKHVRRALETRQGALGGDAEVVPVPAERRRR